jgi:prepilin-type N-terminal cleavage/methylation domain-containing protein
MFLFHHIKKTKKSGGFTLIEMVIGISILAMIFSMLGYWFTIQRKSQARITTNFVGQQNVLLANLRMVNEMRISRLIIYPSKNEDNSIHTDSKVIFKNSSGDYVCYYHDKDKAEIRRCLIPNGEGDPIEDTRPLARGIDEIYFTARGNENRLIDIVLRSQGTFGMESIYLIND